MYYVVILGLVTMCTGLLLEGVAVAAFAFQSVQSRLPQHRLLAAWGFWLMIAGLSAYFASGLLYEIF